MAAGWMTQALMTYAASKVVDQALTMFVKKKDGALRKVKTSIDEAELPHLVAYLANEIDEGSELYVSSESGKGLKKLGFKEDTLDG